MLNALDFYYFLRISELISIKIHAIIYTVHNTYYRIIRNGFRSELFFSFLFSKWNRIHSKEFHNTCPNSLFLLSIGSMIEDILITKIFKHGFKGGSAHIKKRHSRKYFTSHRSLRIAFTSRWPIDFDNIETRVGKYTAAYINRLIERQSIRYFSLRPRYGVS